MAELFPAKDKHHGIGTSISLAEAPEDLSAIHQPGCNAAIWHRQTLPGFQTWIDEIDPGQLPKARVILHPQQVHDAASHICDVCGTPNCPERALLIDDVAALAGIFAGLMHAQYLSLRLDVVTTNACRKFHVDTVTARLICTYRGTGTQYGISVGSVDPQVVHTVPTCAPILLRGKLWPEQTQQNLLHRSPPIEGTGETRLVLVLDPIIDPDDHPDRKHMH